MLAGHRFCLTFSALLRERWGELKAFTTTAHFAPGGVIFSVGQPSDAMYLIESGRAKVSQLSAEGREKIIGIYQTGDLLGEVCICKNGARENQAVALESLAVASFRVKELLGVLQRTPEMVFSLLMVFCARVAECQDQVASLAFDEVRTRLAKEMLRLSDVPAGPRKRESHPLPIQLTHQDLASLVDTTRENATKIMNEFREEGLLNYSREGIVLFPERMETYLKKRRS